MNLDVFERKVSTKRSKECSHFLSSLAFDVAVEKLLLLLIVVYFMGHTGAAAAAAIAG